jgi:hypothetical protein
MTNRQEYTGENVDVQKRVNKEAPGQGNTDENRPPGYDGSGSISFKPRTGKRTGKCVNDHHKGKGSAERAPAPAKLLDKRNLKNGERSAGRGMKPLRGERETDDNPAVEKPGAVRRCFAGHRSSVGL